MNTDHLKDYSDAAWKSAKPIFPVAEKDEKALKEAPAGLRALAKAIRFTGEAGVVVAGKDGALLGVGDRSDPFVYAAAAEKLGSGDYRFEGKMSRKASASAMLAWLLGGYKFTRYKTQKTGEATLVAPKGADARGARRRAAAVALVRDLVNTPAGDMLPDALETEARLLAEKFSASLDVITGGDLLSRNFPMVHAVGRASAVAPRLLDLTWGREDAPRLTLVGKGVCFDSGGLNIKGASGMRLMKKDMGGAANALGLAHMIMDAKMNVRLRVLIPAVENAISGSAFRPGDILKSRKGLTVEIGNTDAEGRLVLADALTYGGEEKPDLMISLATLTGAARVALGPDLAPYYTDDDDLADAIAEAGAQVNDPVWRMPLWAPYAQMLSSPVADINNVTDAPFAGSVTAALFLKKFVPAKTGWAHFDIYAWRPKPLPGRPVGGEAHGVRALFEVLAARYR